MQIFLSFSYLFLPPEPPAALSPPSWPNKICLLYSLLPDRPPPNHIPDRDFFSLPTSIKTPTLASLSCQDGAFCKLTESESQHFEEPVQIGRQIQK